MCCFFNTTPITAGRAVCSFSRKRIGSINKEVCHFCLGLFRKKIPGQSDGAHPAAATSCSFPHSLSCSFCGLVLKDGDGEPKIPLWGKEKGGRVAAAVWQSCAGLRGDEQRGTTAMGICVGLNQRSEAI